MAVPGSHGNTAERIVNLLARGAALDSRQVAAQVGRPLSTVGKVLTELHRDGKIVNVGTERVRRYAKLPE